MKYGVEVILKNSSKRENRISHSHSHTLCDLRLPPGLQYEVVTFGLLPSVTFFRFLTSVSGPHICPTHWTLKMGRIFSPEALVKNRRKATLGNDPNVTPS